ncbi:MAG: hypothetical protein NVSMB57_05480 [Actinomycetota bacterium]
MILHSMNVDTAELAVRTGWEIKPEGACRGEMCVPLRSDAPVRGRVDARVLSERLRMPLISDEEHTVWALGPSTLSGRTLDSAEAPSLTLPDHHGREFDCSSLRGQKIFLLAWASW